MNNKVSWPEVNEQESVREKAKEGVIKMNGRNSTLPERGSQGTEENPI